MDKYMKPKLDRPNKIVKANTKPCDKCEKHKGSKLLFDDYLEELSEYAMDAPGSYQGAGVWGGTGNYGFGGVKQISGQKLNPATKHMADLEQNLKTAHQKDDYSYEEEFANWKLDRIEDKFEDHDIQAEAYPTTSPSRSGTGSTFANLPGWPRTNTLTKKMDFIPDDKPREEQEAMKDQEEDWLDHLSTQPQPWENAEKMAKRAAEEQGGGLTGLKTKSNRAAPANNNTPSNGLGYSSLASPRKYVPDEIDQYRDDTKDILWKIGRENTF